MVGVESGRGGHAPLVASVEFQDVCFSYDSGIQVLRDVSFSVPSGALFGLIGPNGAGKSTSINILTTLLSPDSGNVSVCGVSVTSQATEARRRIGYAPEEPLVYGGLTAQEFVELSATLHGMSQATGREEARRLLEIFGLTSRSDEMLCTYSKGMRRKAMLAAAMVHDPELLVLDEPLDGLDVVAQATLKSLLTERTRRGASVVYSTHILEIVESICTHVAVLQKGCVLAHGALDDVRSELGVSNLAAIFKSEVSDG